MEITKQLLEQTQIAAGTAASNINDGWTQLNLLFEQFKEVLAEVGKIFSTIFGPVLSTLNSVISIPFVKSTTAWGIALGAIVLGYRRNNKSIKEFD
jgi:phage-related minor tail protein